MSATEIINHIKLGIVNASEQSKILDKKAIVSGKLSDRISALKYHSKVDTLTNLLKIIED